MKMQVKTKIILLSRMCHRRQKTNGLPDDKPACWVCVHRLKSRGNNFVNVDHLISQTFITPAVLSQTSEPVAQVSPLWHYELGISSNTQPDKSKTFIRPTASHHQSLTRRHRPPKNTTNSGETQGNTCTLMNTNVANKNRSTPHLLSA